MQFKDIIGQEDVKSRLRRSVREGRIPHAQLLWGPSGVGKLQLAIAYAQYIACPHRTDEDSCGECPTCRQFQRLEHPDLHFVFPIFKADSGRDSVCDDFIDKFRNMVLSCGYFDSADWYAAIGAETKQCIIYAAESGEIMRKLSLKAYTGGYKVMIIWLPEKMHPVCANKLLKLLEEPPEQTLFLLVSEEPDALLPTILSRTQQIKVPRLQEQEIAEALVQKKGVEVALATDYAHIANGSYLQALKLLSSREENRADFSSFVEIMRLAYRVAHRSDYSALVEIRQWCDTMAAKTGRERQKRFLQYMQQEVRENFVRNFGVAEANYQTSEERTFSERFAPFINERNVENIVKEIQLAQQQIEQNGNAKIILFDLCLQLMVLLKK
ncbi:MAG TPA: DNA polymerase III subunit delta' [Bacteroidales bacterium]|nr:DNA polymerase III subunit delta' [Bacteroidales bacterium]